jgi:hypothetical protein
MPLRIRDLESEEEDESKGEQKTKTTPLDSLYSSLLIKSQFLLALRFRFETKSMHDH